MRLMTAAIVINLIGAMPAMAQEEKPFEGATVTAIAGADLSPISDGDAKFIYGGQLGYDWQSKSLVYGIEAEATGRTRSGCVSFSAPYYRGCDRGGRELYIGGRFGTTVGDSTLLYAKAGYVNRRDTYEYQTVTDGPVTIGHNSADGFRVGAGIEHRLGGALSLKVEYRYSHLAGFIDHHQTVGGLSFRF